MNIHRTAQVLRNPGSYGLAALIVWPAALVGVMLVAAWLMLKYCVVAAYWMLRLPCYDLPKLAYDTYVRHFGRVVR